MFTHTSFRQGTILAQYPYDPRTHGGVCVALCDYWLHHIRRNPGQPVEQRLQHLEAVFPQVMRHQIRYGRLRRQGSREEARVQVGRSLGLDYDTDHTVVTRAMTGLSGVKAKIKHDLGYIAAGATWSLHFAERFVDGEIIRSGHAIAGFVNCVRRDCFMAQQIHLFDPNLGEYIGDLQQTDAMLDDIFGRVRLYRTTVEMHRTTEV